MTPRADAILHVAPALDEGPAGTTVGHLVAGATGSARRCFVAAGRGPLVAEVEFAGARFVEIDLGGGRPVALWRAAARLEELVRREAIGLLHAHGELAALVAQRVARRTQRPWVASLAEAVPRTTRWAASLGLDGRGRADRVVVPSQDLAERLAAAGEVAHDRLRVVPPAVDLSRFDPATVSGARLRQLRHAWGLAMDRPVVLLPGPVVASGGHLELLRALNRLGREDVLAVFTGDGVDGGAYRKQIELFVRTAGMGGQILFADAESDAPAAFALARVVALPTVEVPPAFTPLPLEAQAMGTPVIVHAVGALPEVLMPAATGWLVEAGDTEGLTEALRLALALPEDVRARTAERARAFVAEDFGAERMVAGMGDVYAELAAAAVP